MNNTLTIDRRTQHIAGQFLRAARQVFIGKFQVCAVYPALLVHDLDKRIPVITLFAQQARMILIECVDVQIANLIDRYAAALFDLLQ